MTGPSEAGVVMFKNVETCQRQTKGDLTASNPDRPIYTHSNYSIISIINPKNLTFGASFETL
jgi:hypothetical protein